MDGLSSISGILNIMAVIINAFLVMEVCDRLDTE